MTDSDTLTHDTHEILLVWKHDNQFGTNYNSSHTRLINEFEEQNRPGIKTLANDFSQLSGKVKKSAIDEYFHGNIHKRRRSRAMSLSYNNTNGSTESLRRPAVPVSRSRRIAVMGLYNSGSTLVASVTSALGVNMSDATAGILRVRPRIGRRRRPLRGRRGLSRAPAAGGELRRAAEGHTRHCAAHRGRTTSISLQFPVSSTYAYILCAIFEKKNCTWIYFLVPTCTTGRLIIVLGVCAHIQHHGQVSTYLFVPMCTDMNQVIKIPDAALAYCLSSDTSLCNLLVLSAAVKAAALRWTITIDHFDAGLDNPASSSQHPLGP